jgi:thioredoxin
VLKSPVPVLVDFWAPWCGPCKMIAPILDEIAKEHAGKVRVAKIDVDQNPALAARFNIRGIPTMMLFHNGAVKETIVGLAGKQAIVSKLEALAAG